MQTLAADQLDATFQALADRTRRAILARLADGEATVNELAAPFDMSQPSISRHLKVLEMAGLIERGANAQFRPRRLKPETLKEAAVWVDQFRELWSDSFDRLDDYLKDVMRDAPRNHPTVKPKAPRTSKKGRPHARRK
jgi:DNA-binding transcriptional ArsR family regulator